MNLLKKVTLFIVFLLLVSCSSSATKSETQAELQSGSYEQLVQKYLEVTNMQGTFNVVIPQIIGMLKPSAPNVPEEFWIKFENEIKASTLRDLSVLYAPIYQKYLTKEDLSNMIGFYETPTGKKVAEVTPKITVEAMSVGEKWGADISRRAMEQLKADGYMQ